MYKFSGGYEFLVNTQTVGTQDSNVMTRLANGNFVVAWRDQSSLGDGSSSSVKAQIFTPTGEKIGGEFLVNTVTHETQALPEISRLSDGGFVVVWVDYSEAGPGIGISNKGQRFDASGVKQGPEFRVDTETVMNQDSPAVAGLANGGFAVTWMDASGTLGDSSATSIKAQLFDIHGDRVGPEFLVNTTTLHNQQYPAIAALSNGNFVVTWADSSQSPEDNDTGIRAQIFNAVGGKVGSEFLVNSVTDEAQDDAAVTALRNGNFVVTWCDHSTAVGEGIDTNIKGQMFDAGGNKLGNEFLVNTQTANRQNYAEVSALDSGGFAVTWIDWSRSLGDNDWSSIKARVYDASGAPFGTEFLVNLQTSSEQSWPHVTDLIGGGFAISWMDNSGMGGDSQPWSIKARIFTPALNLEADSWTGSPDNDVIDGREGNDTLDGAAGNDTLYGFDGDDLIFGGTGADGLVGGNGNDTLLGGERWDTMYGGDGNDILDGGLDNDQMYGGAGNDLYYVDHIGDRTYELVGQGNDTVISSISLALSADVDNLTLTGTAALTGTGNGLANRIIGNDGANTLSGGASADTIDGGLGADSIDGGIGNDSLLGGGRWDTLIGGDGSDTLDGGEDNDQMYGGLGNDLYYVDHVGDRVNESTSVNEGSDTVFASISWNLTANIEAVVFTGAADASSTGNSLHNTMTGNTGNNTFTGGTGHDTINGGDGNDLIDGGIDSDVLDGGIGNDTLTGGQRWDTLIGGAGDDVLNGGTENDRMTGNSGNDSYFVDHIGDRVFEVAGEGNDSVYSTIDFTLSAEVENLALQGTAVSGVGNGLANRISGTSGANILSGGHGNDTLTGGAGADTLTGGTGRDDFVFGAAASTGADQITDFVHSIDRLVFKGSDYGFAAGHVLTAAQFTLNSSAIGTGAQFGWDSAMGHLWFDADGTGMGGLVSLGWFDGTPTVTKEDLYFTA